MQNITREDLERWDRTHYWHSFTQMAEYEPLIFERGEGCVLYDLEGRALIDGISNVWCNLVGHRHPRLDAAVIEQLGQLAHCTSLGAAHPTTIRLAKKLADIAPGDLDHVFFSSDGSSAIEAALKIAFQYWRQCPDPQPQKTKYIALAGAYHGDTLGSVSVGGVKQFRDLFSPLLFEVLHVPTPDLYRLPSGIEARDALGYYLAQLEQVLQKNHEQIAAMVIEPVAQVAAGMMTHPPGYLRAVRALTKQYGVLLVADEVAVGMGRTGTLFACQQEQVIPDLLCLAKGLTGGYLPLAATLVRSEIYRAFLGDYADLKTFFHGHTYSGNPLAAAVALATLEVLEEEQILESLPPKIGRLELNLARLAEHPHVGDVRQRGLMAGIELVQDKESKRPFDWRERRGQQVCRHAIEQGVWLRPLGNDILILPPLTISFAELDRICDAVEYGIKRITFNSAGV